MNLSDFLAQAGSIYSSYEEGQVASDQASAAQATAKTQAAAAAAQSEQNKVYLKWGIIAGAVLLGVVILIVVVKKLR